MRIPKLRKGSFTCSSRAGGSIEPGGIVTSYVTGTSTRKVDDLVKALGCDFGVSKSTVSRICADIDREVAPVRQRPLGHTAFPYVFLDAAYVKARVTHQVVSRAVVIATDVTTEGGREVLGVDVGDSEDAVFWTCFLASLKDPGHRGLHASIRKTMQELGGSAAASNCCSTSSRTSRAGRPRWSPRPCSLTRRTT